MGLIFGLPVALWIAVFLVFPFALCVSLLLPQSRETLREEVVHIARCSAGGAMALVYTPFLWTGRVAYANAGVGADGVLMAAMAGLMVLLPVALFASYGVYRGVVNRAVNLVERGKSDEAVGRSVVPFAVVLALGAPLLVWFIAVLLWLVFYRT